MVGKLGRIAALFGSKSSLGTTSAHPSTITLYGDEDGTRSEANFKRSWSFRLSRKKKKDHNRLNNHGGQKTEPVFQSGGGGGGQKTSVISSTTAAVQQRQPTGATATAQQQPPIVTEILQKPPPPATAGKQQSSPATIVPLSAAAANIRALVALRHSAKGAEALAVLVNYLVYSLEAFTTPKLKRDLENTHNKWVKTKLELEEVNMSYARLENSFKNEKDMYELSLEEAFRNHEEEKNELNDKFREEYSKLSSFHEEKINEIKEEFERKVAVVKEQLIQEFHNDIETIKKLHLEELESVGQENLKEKNELKEIYARRIEEYGEKEDKLTKQLEELQSQCEALKENETLFMNSLGKNAPLKISRQKCCQLESEVDSLRTVLEMKSSELLELRRQSQIWQRDAEQLPQALHKVTTLQSRLEGLQAQLSLKEANEQRLLQENRMLLDTIEKESSQKKRLSLHNEELQWKLKQNCEVVQALAALSGPVPVTRTKVTARTSYSLNKTASEADINSSRIAFESPNQNGSGNQSVEMFEDDSSSPGSPKVKAVIEKADSVAWVVDIDENPQNIANRLLKRAQSLRGTSTPTPTPSKSAQHRPRNRSSQSLSISSTSSKSSPCTPELRKSPDCSGASGGSDQGWGDVVNIDEVEHITEEVIVVKSIGDKNVLELLDVDDSEIHIDDLPKKEPSVEEMMMLRRVEQAGLRADTLMPKDSAGEAMISGEASDDDEEEEEDEDEDDDDDQLIEHDDDDSDDVESSLCDSYFSDKDSEQDAAAVCCDFLLDYDKNVVKFDEQLLMKRRRRNDGAHSATHHHHHHHHNQNNGCSRSNKDLVNMELSWSEDSEVVVALQSEN